MNHSHQPQHSFVENQLTEPTSLSEVINGAVAKTMNPAAHDGPLARCSLETSTLA